MDFHNDVRSHVIPETEEFIESIGHMASEEDILYLQVGLQYSMPYSGVLSHKHVFSVGESLRLAFCSSRPHYFV